MMTERQAYADAVGEFLRSFREEHGLTLDAVARAGREHGASWGTASVGNIEAAKAALTVPTLVTLALALNRLTGRALTLSDLLGSTEFVTLMPGAQPVSRPWLDRVLAGDSVTLKATDIASSRPYEERKAADELAALQAETGHLRDPTDQEVVRALVDMRQEPPEEEGAELTATPIASLAEMRAAKKIGVEPAELQRWAKVLWGRSLEQEAFRRAGHESTPQKRGRVTRTLVEEIRKAEEAESLGPQVFKEKEDL